MGRRPGPLVSIGTVQDRRYRGVPRPWIARWTVARKGCSKAFSHRAQADDYTARLRIAAADGERFDLESGEPVSWKRSELTIAEWARTWVSLNWPTWKDNTRRSHFEGLERVLPMLVKTRAPAMPDDVQAGVRAYLRPATQMTPETKVTADWFKRWSLPLVEITPGFALTVWAQLGIGVKGKALAPTTARRLRSPLDVMLQDAVDAEHIDKSPLPSRRQRDTAKSRTKNKQKARIKLDVLPNPAQVRTILAAVSNHQPTSITYQAFFATMYFSAMRPSEVTALRPRDLELPDEGWGKIVVRRSLSGASTQWRDDDEVATGGLKWRKLGEERTVPIPPELALVLRKYLDEHPAGIDEFVFRTARGRPLNPSNLTRSWSAAKKKALGVQDPLLHCRIYDLRHAQLTLQLRSGISPAVIARRAGHDEDVLLRTYSGLLSNDDAVANALLEAVL